ncbi:MAG: DNRLRE domain-containing protein [Polyangiaceae bacterium]|nr:DNRLRE domain-containing protein [Polyangiaceae bacterium]
MRQLGLLILLFALALTSCVGGNRMDSTAESDEEVARAQQALAPTWPPAPPDATCVVIQRGAMGDVFDSDISEGNGNWVAGAYPYNWTGPSPYDHWAIYQFDLSPIPPDAVVISSTFATYVSWNLTHSEVRGHRITAPWSEATASWVNFGGTASWDPASVGTFDPEGVGYQTMDLTGLVAGWVSGDEPNFGLLLEESPPSLHAYFTSEAGNVGLRPALQVCYETGPCAGKPDGALCDDGDPCTIGETCTGLTCGNGAPVTCEATDDCHDDGVCDPQTGLCEPPAKPDGSLCDDGNICTSVDTCQAGTCQGGESIDCDDGNECTIDICDPISGCISDPAPNGTPCSNGTCESGVCTLSGLAFCGVVQEVAFGVTQPSAGATVSVSGDAPSNIFQNTVTAADGSYCLVLNGGALNFTTYYLTAKKPGFNSQTKSNPGDFTVIMGTTVNVNFLIDQITEGTCFEDDFETNKGWVSSAPVAGVSWQNKTNIPIVPNNAVGVCVTLAPDENCVPGTAGCPLCPNVADPACIPQAGAVSNAFQGAHAYWFGNSTNGTYTGNFMAQNGTCASFNGGSGGSAVSGSLTSPLLTIPPGSALLQFRAWWEIESVDPQQFAFDQLLVQVVSGATVTTIGTLNPEIDTNGFSGQPYSSGGFDAAPVWSLYEMDLSAYAGQNVQIRFRFQSQDSLYNAFRGWMVDTVTVYGSGCTPAQCQGQPNGTACDDGNACTVGDTCQTGVCVAGAPVVCTALDQCHDVGVCNIATGSCSNPIKVDGSACDDGNGCTAGDSCQAGTCQPGGPLVCVSDDPCKDPGVCDPIAGACTPPVPKANGAACDDGNPCTTSDTCQAGTCLGANPVVCTPLDDCHLPGVCDPGSGGCTNPVKANGSSCTDGNACTQSDSCVAGVCTGTNPVVCAAAPGDCYDAGVCNPASGACSPPAPKPNGVACSDGNACTQSDSCQSGICTGSNPVICTASGPCTYPGSCDPATGACGAEVPKPDGSTCDDGNVCTPADVCLVGSCVGQTTDTDGDGQLDGCDDDDDNDGLLDPDDVYPLDPVPVADYSDAIQCLLSSQDNDGTFGPDSYRVLSTCAAVEMLGRVGEKDSAYWVAYDALWNANKVNTDQLACSASALNDATRPTDDIGRLQALAHGQADGFDPWLGIASTDIPGTGWGVASAYSADPYTTSLVLQSFLDSGAFTGETSVAFTGVISPATFAVVGSFDVPSGADSLSVGLTGEYSGNLDLYVKLGAPPTPFDFDYVTTSDRALDFISETGGVLGGTYYVAVGNPDPTITTAAYLATGYNTGDLDSATVTSGLLFLVSSQKDGGSWGLGPVNEGDPRTTCEALETLYRFGLGSLQETADGLNWALSTQLPDGSFGSLKTTVTCHQMLVYAGSAAGPQKDAYDFIVGQQAAGGCYEDPLATALSIEILSQMRRAQ